MLGDVPEVAEVGTLGLARFVLKVPDRDPACTEAVPFAGETRVPRASPVLEVAKSF